MDTNIDTEAIQTLVNEIKNDEYVKVDREIVGTDTFAKLNSTMKPETLYTYETSKDECERILERLENGLYTCVERPNLGNADDKSLSSQINQTRYSVSYSAVFQQNNLGEIFIVCQNKEREKEILELLKSKSNTNENENLFTKVNSYTTIQKAVENASPGQPIIVDDGIYHESIIIDKSVEIKALNVTEKKEEKKVEILADTGDCFTLQANSARLEGLKINCNTPGDTFCTKAITGILEIENCQLISSSAACFRADEKARLTIKDCELYSVNSTASLMPESRAVIMDCRFTQPKIEKQSQHEAIVVNSQATCILIDCTINSMINFEKNSYGMLLRCHISTQGDFIKGDGNGVYVHEGAEPLIQDCEIFNCIESGIRLDPKSKGVINHCNIYNNYMFGFLSIASEQFLITDSHIHDNMNCGVRTVDGAKGDIVNTKFISNNKNAILVENGCDITMKHCEILDHITTATGAIYLKEPQEKTKRITKFSLIDSICKGNITGINISSNTDAYIIKSQIRFNNYVGIIVEGNGKVEFNESKVCENGRFQLTCHNPSANKNSAGKNSGPPAPSSARISAKDTTFGPYPKNCIHLSGKSISNFSDNCNFNNNFLKFLNSAKNMYQFDIDLSRKKIETIENDIKVSGETPELTKKRKENEMIIAGCQKNISLIDNELVQYNKENISINKRKRQLKMYKDFIKISPSIVIEGDARCTISKSEFKSNISFIDAKGSSFTNITNTKFSDDSLLSIRISENASLDMKDSQFSFASIGVVLDGKVKASISRTLFNNSYGYSINAQKNDWELNLTKSKITLGVGDMINLTGKGKANFTENSFIGREINKGETKLGQKTGGADTAIHLIDGPEATISSCLFHNLQSRGICGDKSTVIVKNNNFEEIHNFPLIFEACSIEVMENTITNYQTKPDNSIHLKDGCNGKICNNKYFLNNMKFLQAIGRSSSVQVSNNNPIDTASI